MKRFSDYDQFAWLYNHHWGDFAERALPVIEELGLNHLLPGSRILDLCCGTGQLAQLLTERGFQVTGVDGSEEMLAYARENAPKSTFILADARDFDAGTGFDMAVSTFDSLNHVMNLGELSLVFTHVIQTLRPGGIFIFDLNMDAGFRARWNGSSFGVVEEDLVFVVRNAYNTKNQVARFMLTMFSLQEDQQLWSRTDLTLTQRAYPEALVINALEIVGFVQVDTTEPMGVGRTFFVAHAPI